ncbi:hypothetical protein YC2023_097786 [Brassica napus]
MCLRGPVYTLVAVTVSREVFYVSSAEQWCERVVLTPTNNTVHEVNAYLLSKVPSNAKVYLSSDSIELEATPDDDKTLKMMNLEISCHVAHISYKTGTRSKSLGSDFLEKNVKNHLRITTDAVYIYHICN